MCYGCYKEYGSPAIITKTTQHVANLVAKVYEFSSVGGNAHVVIDDYNIEDDHIDWCLREGLSSNVHEHDEKQLAIEKELLEALRLLSIDERVSALAIHDGFIK